MAFELGEPDVDGMLKAMSVKQFSEWKAYFSWRNKQQQAQAG